MDIHDPFSTRKSTNPFTCWTFKFWSKGEVVTGNSCTEVDSFLPGHAWNIHVS